MLGFEMPEGFKNLREEASQVLAMEWRRMGGYLQRPTHSVIDFKDLG
jgi:hypothetical protein